MTAVRPVPDRSLGNSNWDAASWFRSYERMFKSCSCQLICRFITNNVLLTWHPYQLDWWQSQTSFEVIWCLPRALVATWLSRGQIWKHGLQPRSSVLVKHIIYNVIVSTAWSSFCFYSDSGQFVDCGLSCSHCLQIAVMSSYWKFMTRSLYVLHILIKKWKDGI
jgi:hypothetical protein